MRHTGKLAAVPVLCAAACAPQLPFATPHGLDKAQGRWPGISMLQLTEGRTAYVGACAGCHSLFAPTAFSSERWLASVDSMRQEEDVELSDAEVLSIKQYLFATSRSSGGTGSGDPRNR